MIYVLVEKWVINATKYNNVQPIKGVDPLSPHERKNR